ncbi:hypothetical protein GCM10022393_16920 [Aquimarina addita]|uniref:DUF2007 domain-containing protein n=1 Tax=Aquimarina addita TaxID=870485 RepID=A0ABP7XHH6_9FLAO
MEEMFKTVAVYQYSSEALIFKGRLEAEGIEVFMKDMHTIDTDPLVSNAIGGVKVRVRIKDEPKALGILKDIGNYSYNDIGKRIQCPNCQSDRVEYFTTIKDIESLLAFLFGFIFGIFPFYTKYSYRCEACRHKFNLK